MVLFIKNLFTKNSFTYSMIAFIILGAFLFIIPKHGIVLYINKHFTSDSLDFFFRYYTDSALGGSYVIVGIIALLYSLQKSAQICITGILVLLVAYITKQFIFPDFMRPTAEISFSSIYHIIQDFSYATRNSFPSGHTMSAFGLATVLSFMTNKKYLQVLLFVYACSIAYSRMYLLQHFYMDVYAGAVLGFLLANFGVYIVSKIPKMPTHGILKK